MPLLLETSTSSVISDGTWIFVRIVAESAAVLSLESEFISYYYLYLASCRIDEHHYPEIFSINIYLNIILSTRAIDLIGQRMLPRLVFAALNLNNAAMAIFLAEDVL